MSAAQPSLSILIPMYNEASGLAMLFERLLPLLAQTGCPYEIIAVDDGSQDDTFAELEQWSQKVQALRILKLSRNFGKENAMMAGFESSTGDVVIPIDADLQDPPELILEMLERWREGYQVVYARRISRDGDCASKRWSAQWFYRLFNRFSMVSIPRDAGDFRLMDRVAVDALLRLGEQNRFTKGLFAWIGFRQCSVDFERKARASGDSKWGAWKLWNFALDGITGFTTAPLRIWSYLGALIALGALAYAAFLVIRTLIYGIDLPGYASIMVVILVLGGIQLIGIGVIGEYLGRVYLETKRRPLYIVERRIGFAKREEQ